jgi:hypothetical protein
MRNSSVVAHCRQRSCRRFRRPTGALSRRFINGRRSKSAWDTLAGAPGRRDLLRSFFGARRPWVPVGVNSALVYPARCDVANTSVRKPSPGQVLAQEGGGPETRRRSGCALPLAQGAVRRAGKPSSARNPWVAPDWPPHTRADLLDIAARWAAGRPQACS